MNRSRFPGWRARGGAPRGLGLCPLAAAALALLLPACSPRTAVSDGAQLVVNGAELRPTETLELRFDSPMVSPALVGETVPNAPLRIKPPLAGAFRWVSERSGVFTPHDPLPLGTRFRFRLAPGLRDAQGAPLKARLDRTLATAPFRVEGWTPSAPSADAPCEPAVRLLFNAPVSARDAAGRARFIGPGGRVVRAEVRQGLGIELPMFYEVGRASASWSPPTASPLAPPDGEAPDTNVVSEFLVATPREPLGVGKGWRFVLARGMPAETRGLRTRGEFTLELGEVTPFELRAAEPENFLRRGKSVRLAFTRPASPELTNRWAEWLSLTPPVADARFETDWSGARLKGDFALGVSYTLRARAGLPAEGAQTLAKAAQFEFRMPPVPPRLYFPSLSHEQMATGRRELGLLAVNVPRLRVRAKALDRATLIHALRGYRGYFRDWDERADPDEPFTELDFNLLAGRTSFDQEWPGATETDTPRAFTLRWDELLAGRPAGAVFVEATRVKSDAGPRPRLGTQTLIQLTDLGLAWKQPPDDVLAWVFSQQTGQPVAGAQVGLFTDDNVPLAEAMTDASGCARLPAATNAAWMLAQLGEDLHALPLGENRVAQPWFDFDLPWEGGAGRDLAVLLFTDRPVYRPGETAHLKAIVREWRADRLALPTNETAQLSCCDARGQSFLLTNLPLSELGSCALDVPLPDDRRGVFTARLKLGEHETRWDFSVQDFQPSAFEVVLRARPEFAAGEKVELPLGARYLFGQPLARAKVAWSLTATDDDWQPAGFEGFRFLTSDLAQWKRQGPASAVVQGDAELRGAEPLLLTPEIPLHPTAPSPRRVHLLAEVTDLNQQTLSHGVAFLRHSSDFYLGLRAPGFVKAGATSAPVELVAVGADGRPWPRPVTARVNLQRVEYHTVRLEGAGRVRRYSTERISTNLLEREFTVPPLSVTEQATGAPREIQGALIPGLALPEAGTYLVEVTAADDAGRAVRTGIALSAAERTATVWDYRNEVWVELVPDRDEYEPGQVASLLVKTPISGQALVTVERESVRRSFVTTLTGNAPSLQVPILEGDEPNLFVSVVLVRGAADCPREVRFPDFRAGWRLLRVKSPRNRLTVTLTPSATNCLPGAAMTIAAAVADRAGAPVPGAEVTLWAVDEGVLGLMDYALPDPCEHFQQPRPLRVETAISLPRLLAEDPERRSFHNKGFLIGGGGLERVRKNFLACAFWQADLRADAQGRVQTTFTAPDSLARYRLFALAHAGVNRFGRGESAFQVSKPIMLEPALPRFANLGDAVTARALVFNHTGQSGDIAASLELDDHAVAPTPECRVTVPAGGTDTVEFPLRFTKPGVARWTWRARFADGGAAGFTDAVESTLEVGHGAPLLRQVLLARVDGSVTNLLAAADPRLLGGEGTLRVVVANTRLAELGEAVSQLLHYPYGCAEQTASSLLPWVALRDVSAMQPFLRRGTNDPDAAIRAGVARLLSMQRPDGGLGYWPGPGEAERWVSAYAGVVLALAEQAGAEMPAEELDRLWKYLRRQLRGLGEATNTVPPAEACLGVYALALAGKAEPAYHETLFRQRERLSVENRALLALAIGQSDGPAAMADELLRREPARAAGGEDGFGCAARERAVRLLAWTRHRPDDPRVDGLVTDLLRDQREAHWRTTQGNAWAVFALTEYARRVESRRGATRGELVWAGQRAAFDLPEEAASASHVFSLTRGLASAPLRLDQPAGARLFAELRLEAFPPAGPQPREDRGFSLARSYTRLDDENRPQPDAPLRVGDRVLVTLRLGVPKAASYLVIDDALPCLLEALNPEFQTQQTRGGAAATAAMAAAGERLLWCDHREMRAERVLCFANAVPPGQYTLSYVARVRAAGTARAPSAKAEEMYHPDRFGLSGSAEITSLPME